MTNLISRNREQLQYSKNPNVATLIQNQGIVYVPEAQGPFIDWRRGRIQFGDENFETNRPEDETPEQEMQRYEQQRDRFFAGQPQALSAQFNRAWNQLILNALTNFEVAENPNWVINHERIIPKVEHSANGLQISFKHSPVKFSKSVKKLNKATKKVEFKTSESGFEGELNIFFEMAQDENGEAVFAVEKVESSNPVIDDLMMGENMGPIRIAACFSALFEAIKPDENNNFNIQKIGDCEKLIHKKLEKSKISPMQRVAFSVALTALNAVLQKPNQIGDYYLEFVNFLAQSAWGLCKTLANEATTILETYFQTLQSWIPRALEIDPSGTLNQLLYKHEKEIAPQRASNLINNYLAQAFSSNTAKYNLALQTVLTQKPENDPEIEEKINQLQIENPRGLFYGRLADIEEAIELLSKEKSSSPNTLNALRMARVQATEFLYFNCNSWNNEGNKLLKAVAERLDYKGLNSMNIFAILENAHQALKPAPAEKPKWWQFWRVADRRKYEKFRLQEKLHSVAKNNNLDLQEKLFHIEQAIKEAMPFAFWRKPEREEYLRLQQKTRLLCATEAFAQGDIDTTSFAAQLNRSGQHFLAAEFQKQLKNDIDSSVAYREKHYELFAKVHHNSNTVSQIEKISEGPAIDVKNVMHLPVGILQKINQRVIAFNNSLNQASFFAKRQKPMEPVQAEKTIEKMLDEVIEAKTIFSH